MSRGFLLYAFNNDQINYLEMAIACGLAIQQHSKVKNVSIVTDKGSIKFLERKNLLDRFNIIVQKPNSRLDRQNIKVFYDTAHHREKAVWHNTLRCKAYELSPYEETILIDSDYLVQSNNVDLLWGSDQDFRIQNSYRSLNKEPIVERLNLFSIPLYWATVVYFRKGEMADLIFQLINHIQENYHYYRMVYQFREGLIRNDHIFSIAIHTLSGFLNNYEFNALPYEYLSASDKDELIEVTKGGSKYLVAGRGKSSFSLINVKGVDVHCMNKYSLGRNTNKLIELYE
jgi:hypothetical protein